MRFKNHTSGNLEVFELSGKIMGGEDVCEYRCQVKLCLKSGIRDFLVDMKDVEWTNSAGLGMLVGTVVSVRNAGGRVAFANTDNIYRLLMQTRLIEVFDVYDSREDALTALTAEKFE
jgi:anti-anti-sigma factor